MSVTGTVKFFNEVRGYASSRPMTAAAMCSFTSPLSSAPDKDLADGQRITFDVEPDKKGKGPKAVKLVISS